MHIGGRASAAVADIWRRQGRSDQRLLERYDRTYRYCAPEAIRRGSTDTNSLLYVTALRGCMYRFGITDRGAYAYSANAPFLHFLDR